MFMLKNTLNVLEPIAGCTELIPRGWTHPETFRLPRPGTNDPYFGITRGGYYQGEIEGWWKLIRLKRRGMKRGITGAIRRSRGSHYQAAQGAE